MSKYILSGVAKVSVIKFLFDNDISNCPLGFDIALEKYMSEEYDNLHCVVLNKTCKDFMDLCKKHNVDPKDKQIIINEVGTVLGSNRWRVAPDTILYQSEAPKPKKEMPRSNTWWMDY